MIVRPPTSNLYALKHKQDKQLYVLWKHGKWKNSRVSISHILMQTEVLYLSCLVFTCGSVNTFWYLIIRKKSRNWEEHAYTFCADRQRKKKRYISIVRCRSVSHAHKCGSDALSQQIDHNLWPLPFALVNPLLLPPLLPPPAERLRTDGIVWGEGFSLHSCVVTQDFSLHCLYFKLQYLHFSLSSWFYAL